MLHWFKKILRIILGSLLGRSGDAQSVMIVTEPDEISKYAYNLQEKLRLTYDPTGHPPGTWTVIDVSIGMTGIQTGATFSQSSGSANFDNKCLETLREAGPFQPFASNLELLAVFDETVYIVRSPTPLIQE